MAKKEDFLEDAKGSLKETIGDILSEDITPGNEKEYLKKARSITNIITWEDARILSKLKDKRRVESFEEESDIHFPVFSKRVIEIDGVDDIEEGIGLSLLGIDFIKKVIDKLINHFEFYGVVKNEPVREPVASTTE